MGQQAHGVSVDQRKIQAVVDWPTLNNLKALRGFLGLTGYYRKFIRGYSSIAAPLTALTKQNAFKWDDIAQKVFNDLKNALTSPPVLALPNFTTPFVIEYDASAARIGAVLMQRRHPIAFISQELKQPEKHHLAYEKEMLGILLVTKKQR